MVLEQLDARMLKMTFRPVVHTVHKKWVIDLSVKLGIFLKKMWDQQPKCKR